MQGQQQFESVGDLRGLMDCQLPVANEVHSFGLMSELLTCSSRVRNNAFGRV